MNAVPVVGLGAVSAVGANSRTTFRAVAEGRDGLGELRLSCATAGRPVLAAQIKDALLGCKCANRTLALALQAAGEALRPVPSREHLRTILVFATAVGGMTRSERFYQRLLKDPSRIKYASRELSCHEPTASAGYLCRHYGFQGFLTVSTACSTGLHAVGLCKRLIEHDMCDLALAVGVDALSVLTVRGFASLLLLDPRGCRPFDRDRAGISLGEGAGALLLASPHVVSRSHLRPLALVGGWGATADCHHMTAPHPRGDGARRAVEAALAESGIAASEIDLIAAHGTGTPDNDISEARAMKAVFGTDLPPACSMKRTLGHTLAASGALEAVCAVKALREDTIPRTGGLASPDEEIGMPGRRTGQSRTVRHVVKNAFGFGGNNAALVLSKSSATLHADSPGGSAGLRALHVRGMNYLAPREEPSWEEAVPAAMKRRAPRLWHMAWLAVQRVRGETGISPRSLITASALGAIDETQSFLDGIYRTGFGSPRSFIASVHNGIAGMLAIEFNIRGPNLTFCDGPGSFGSALIAAGFLSEECLPALVLAIEEQTELLHRLQPYLSDACGTFLSEQWEEGAAAFMVERSPSGVSTPWMCGTLSRPLRDGDCVDSACRESAVEAGGESATYFSPLQGLNSTLAPALRMRALQRQGASGRFVVGTYSPSAQSAGAVVLCL